MAGRKVARGIRQLAPGRYEFRTMRAGVAVSETHSAKTDADAKRAFRKWIVQVDEGNVAPAGDTVAALMARYLDHKAAQGRSETTLELYRLIAKKHVLPALGAKAVNRVETADLDAHYGALQAAGVGPIMVKKTHLLIHGALKQGVIWKLLPTNPAVNATGFAPLPAARTAEKTPEVEQVLALVALAIEDDDPDFAMMLWLDAITGVRRGEMVAFRWSCIDWKAETITVRSTLIGIRGGIKEKGTKTDTLRLPLALDPKTMRLLKEHRARCEARVGGPLAADAYLFSPRPGNTEPWRPSSITHKFKRLARKAGMGHLTYHGFRHFNITALIHDGEDIVTVSHRAGHSRPSVTTDIYSHALPEKDRGAANRIAHILK